MLKTIDYEKELNAAQLEAVVSTEGSYLVIAGAGSGKTRVLVFRTAYLVEKGVNPDQILLLTFTRRAATQMLERATQLLDDRCQKVSGGTFHSFANFILRRYAHILELPANFTIIDSADAASAVSLVQEQLGFKKIDKRFPKKKVLLTIISKCVNKGIDIEELIDQEYERLDEWVELIKKIRDEYVVYKKASGLLDYDDLLVYLRNLLMKNQEVRETLSRQYRYIMVDEYQDTNKMQAQIVQLLTCAHKNVMVVGDDAQSIYAFRGAHFMNIINFPKVYEGTKVIMLEENYRSTQPILDLTNEVMNSAAESFKKTLFTSRVSTQLPVYARTRDENGQSMYIVKRIRELQAQGVELNDIAVLFRSGWHSNDLEIELAGQGIAFVKYGGQKFVEAAHIKDLMGFARVVYNYGDEVNWLRVLMLIPRIGARSAAKIVGQIIKEGRGLNIDAAILKKNTQLGQLFDMFSLVKDENLKPKELLEIFLKFYYPLLVDKYDDHDKRLNDLESLIKISGRYLLLREFLVDMTLDPMEKSLVGRTTRENNSSLVLSTIHSAKGLEWNTVFLINLVEGCLPSSLSLASKGAVEEERRLFYVATTRAKQNLYLLSPQIERTLSRMGYNQGGFSACTTPSRFLGEGKILSSLVDVVDSFINS